MEINFFKDHFRGTNVYRTVGSAHKAMLNAVDRLNSSGSFTRIGDTITLDDGTTMNVHEIPKLNTGLLNTVSAKDNVMDFGSARYYKYVNSSGYSRAIFSMPKGSLCGRRRKILILQIMTGRQIDISTFGTIWQAGMR